MHTTLENTLINLNALNMYTEPEFVSELLAHKQAPFKTVATLNGEMWLSSKHSPIMNQYLKEADWCVADGKSLQLLMKFKLKRSCALHPGIDIVTSLLKQSQASFYLVGSSEHVITAAIEKIHSTYPQAKISGYHNGFFNEKEEAAIINDIQKKQPDFILVGMGSPRQERFLLKLKKTVQTGVGIGVGGTFDVLAGKYKRAPKLIRRAGFEWAWRGFQDPKRMKRWNFIPKIFLEALR